MTGNMGYAPNADAAAYLCREILPRVRVRHPKVKFRIVGADPSPTVQALGGMPGVEVTGRVPDLRVHIQRAEVAVAPMRIAAGLQNKMLEGMSMGLPMVATAAANEAIQAVDGEHALIAGDTERFADHIGMLFDHPEERSALGARARELIVAEWSWETHLAKLEQLFDDLVRVRIGAPN